MRTEEVSIFTFDELSDSAKECARDWFRAGFDADDMEPVIEDAARISDLFGLDIRQRRVKLMNGNTSMEPAVSWDLSGGNGGFRIRVPNVE